MGHSTGEMSSRGMHLPSAGAPAENQQNGRSRASRRRDLLLPPQGHRIIHTLDVDLMPEREHDEYPDLPPGHVRSPGTEPPQQPECRPTVDPLLGLRLA